MHYHFEQKIETLAQNAVEEQARSASFEAGGVHFSHWDFNHSDGWMENAWLATGEIEANSLTDAYKTFTRHLIKLIPRIAFVSQCYTDYLVQPFLITRIDSDLGFLRYTESVDGVGLMFMDEEREALNHLLQDETVPNEFFYYWNDAVNSLGYSGKLLLMFSALEALAKAKGGGKDFTKLEKILGPELKKKLFGQKGASSGGLRHRLVHGEYFAASDLGSDYLAEVHKSVIGYFNSEIFEKELLEQEIVRPQRHLLGNRHEYRLFIRAKDGHSLDLKSVLADFSKHGIDDFENYEAVYDEDLRDAF